YQVEGQVAQGLIGDGQGLRESLAETALGHDDCRAERDRCLGGFGRGLRRGLGSGRRGLCVQRCCEDTEEHRQECLCHKIFETFVRRRGRLRSRVLDVFLHPHRQEHLHPSARRGSAIREPWFWGPQRLWHKAQKILVRRRGRLRSTVTSWE